MKIKALFVAPYAAMENLIEECRGEEHDLDLQIKIGNLQEGVKFAKEAETQGIDIIISRGGTAKLIGETVDLPVIDVHLSGYDMLRVLTIANDFPRKKAIVGFSTITDGAKAIIDLLEIPIDIFTIDTEEETEPLLRTLKQEGYQMIMGDVVTYETASRLGLIGVLIQSGREAIREAFKEAKMVSRWILRSKREIDRLKKVLQVTASDFMVLSEKGTIIYEQWPNFEGPPLSNDQLEQSPNSNNGGNREITQVTGRNGEPVKLIKTKIVSEESSFFVYECTPIKRDPIFQENVKASVLSPPLIIHQSEAMAACINMINRCLSYDQFILIGERGTGKELIAKYIHYYKNQGSALFASIKALNALELNPEKMDQDIKTIYVHTLEQLDEGLRENLWRKLQVLKKMGITTISSVLEESPLSGRLYEEEVIRLSIPRLKDRKEDFKELVSSFILHFNQTLGTSVIRINEKGLALLKEYSWPGNVDELKALIKDAVLMEREYVIDEVLIQSLLNRKSFERVKLSSDLLTGSLETIEKKIIEKVLEEEGFNQTKAAKRLKINRSTLWRKLKD